MKKNCVNLLLVVFILTMSGCGSTDFYYDCYNGGEARVPMIKPYELLSQNPEGSWFFYFTPGEQDQMTNIDSIGIKDSIFVVYSNMHFSAKVTTPSPEVRPDNGPTWVIVDAKSGRNYRYQNRGMYLVMLDSLNANNLKLYQLHSVFKNFLKTYKWPPEWPEHE